MEREGGGGGELWYPPHQKRSRVEDKILPFCTRHPLYRQEVVPAGSRQLRVQDPAPARRCITEGKTGHQGRGGGNGDGNRGGGGDETENEYGDKHEGMNAGGNGGGKEMMVEGRESLETYEVVKEVSRKTRERG